MNKNEILKKIGEILDPDLGISIVDLGLIYKVTAGKDTIDILMTLTTPFCPLASTIEGKVKEILASSDPRKISVAFTFDPPWTIDRISEETRLKLGLLS